MSFHSPYVMYSDDYPSVLDLSRSRRGDSVETRKTPSPAYSATSSREAVSPQTSQTSQISQGFIKYHHTDPDTMRCNEKTKMENYMISEYRPEMREESLSPFMLKAAAYQQQQMLLSSIPLTPLTPLTSLDGSNSETSNFDCKPTRPFKAYPRDPLALAASLTASADSTMGLHSAEKYNAFRERMLEQIKAANGGRATISNPKMRRCSAVTSSALSPTSEHTSDSSKDLAYYERRKKNNAAAKKSRDRRRVKEDEIAIRAAFLERENMELKFELAALRKQLALSAGGSVTHMKC